ncbi:MAG: phosphate-starvation-inducible PsiE family protein [Acidimicrobiales bacterium]
MQSHGTRWGALTTGVRLLQAAIAVALFVVGALVLVRTMIDFLGSPGKYPASIVSALDGILVVIIVVDILHTVLTHLRSATFPVRPFLIIGILAGVRDILSASARLTLAGRESPTSFSQSIIELAAGVGVVVALLGGLLLLRSAAEPGKGDIEV